MPAGELACQLVRPEDRRKLELESGVTWELLSDLLPHLVDFMFVTYEPGGRSSSSGKLMRHTGTEFAFLLRGELKIQVGFDEYVLQAGDALSFDSSEPHLLVNEGSEPAEGIWFVLGRRLTPESHACPVAMPASAASGSCTAGRPHLGCAQRTVPARRLLTRRYRRVPGDSPDFLPAAALVYDAPR